MKIAISACYHAGTTSTIELPEGKTWDDIKEWYVKWDSLHYVLKGENEWKEIALDSASSDVIDWKRPTSVEIYAVDEDDVIDWEKALAES